VITDPVPKKPGRPAVYPVTDQWRLEILSRMEALGMRQAELARQVGCSEPTLVLLFRPGGSQKSKLVEAIHHVLKLPPPSPPVAFPSADPSDPVDAELSDVIRRMDDTWKVKLLDIARNFPIKPKG